MKEASPPEIFDRKRRQSQLDRAAARPNNDYFLWQHMANELTERLAYVTRSFKDVLVIGPICRFSQTILSGRSLNVTHAALSPAEFDSTGGLMIEEDRLPFAAASFDLILSAGTLDSVNDLPGALIQMRRILRPDGLFLASLFGSGCLSSLKSAMLLADGERPQAHIHPQIDLRSAADLMNRAGFALPVADLDKLEVRYSDWRALVCDLRNMGLGNMLAGQRSYLGKQYLTRLTEAWAAKSIGGGKVGENFNFIQLSGWAPSPNQPKPAKRGSGSVSLAAALKSKSD
jgi:NADH dehydrogenase [ubiquinone] 1 alpha subcomplex assembly factor 5